MPYNHGVRVQEIATATPAPAAGGLTVVVGTAPVNLAKNPAKAVNTPILVNTFEEAVEAVGYSDDFASYTICEAVDAAFRVAGSGPLVLINVLDPTSDKAAVTEKTYTVTNGQVKCDDFGVILSSVVVKDDSTTLVLDTDYTLSFDEDGYCVVTCITIHSSLKITYDKITPSAVVAADIIGSVNVSTGAETGLECIRQIFPKYGVVPSLIIAPGFSKSANVAAAMAAKCEDINGLFSCECIVDLDSSSGGALIYTATNTKKQAAGLDSPHMDVVWPCVKIGSKIYRGSSIKAAYTALTDAQHDGIPYISPSNIPVDIEGICTEAGAEIVMDEVQANVVNSYGISTFQRFGGWILWGNRTAAYPGATDVKDTFFACRRFFSWWGNTFILAYHSRVDSPTNFRLIEAIVDDENVRGNSLVADGCCAGAYIEYREEDNSIGDLMDGKIRFYQHLAPFTPAEDVLNVLEFDPALFAAAFEEGGNA